MLVSCGWFLKRGDATRKCDTWTRARARAVGIFRDNLPCNALLIDPNDTRKGEFEEDMHYFAQVETAKAPKRRRNKVASIRVPVTSSKNGIDKGNGTVLASCSGGRAVFTAALHHDLSDQI